MRGQPSTSPERDRRVDRGADGRVEHLERTPVGDLGLVLAVPQLRVERELASSVDGAHERTPVAIERDVHPGRRMRHDVIERRRLQVEREHPATEEIALDARLPQPVDPEMPSHGTTRTVSRHQIRRRDPGVLTGFDVEHLGRHMVARLDERFNTPAEAHRDPRKLARFPAQELLHELLRHTVRQLGPGPRCGQRTRPAPRLARSGQPETSELVLRKPSEVGNVGRIVVG